MNTSQLSVGGSEWRDRQTASLLKNPGALNWLDTTFGVTLSVIKRFALGLSPAATTRHYSDALVCPICNLDGSLSSHCVYYTIPGVTSWDPESPVRQNWGPKPPRLYCSRLGKAASTLIVVPSPEHVWALTATELGALGSSEDVLITASSHGLKTFSDIAEIRDVAFWRQWKTVILEKSIAELQARELVHFIDRQVLITRESFDIGSEKQCGPNGVKSSPLRLQSLLEMAAPMSFEHFSGETFADSHKPIDPRSYYHNGHLYYAFEQIVRGVRDGVAAEEYQPFVIKSDHSILTVVKSPRLSSRGRDVYRLTDGTLVNSALKPLPAGDGSWGLKYILQFADDKTGSLQTPAIAELVKQILMHLKASVWLPWEPDYVALTLGIVVSYMQEIFSAVPLFLIVGPPGSGKTVLTEEAARLGCNGRALGRTTLAGLAEATDRCRGLVAVDDLEEIAPGKHAKGVASTNAFQQFVKQSYKKSSGTQTLIGDGMQLKTRNLYGVKVFNNTKGVDEITASRMIFIHTRCRTDEQKRKMEAITDCVLDTERIRTLRGCIHQWVFTNVELIATTYKEFEAQIIERSSEITASLRTVAALTHDPSILEALESVISRLNDSVTALDSEKVFAQVAGTIIKQGFAYISAHHMINQLRLDFGLGSFANGAEYHSHKQSIKLVSSKLINDGWVVPKVVRPRINHEVNARIRAYPVHPDKISEILKSVIPTGEQPPTAFVSPSEFCRGCSTCKYRTHCSLRE